MIDGYVPLMMGPKLIGKIKIDRETSNFEGSLDPEFSEILSDRLDHGLMEVSFFGRPGIPRDVKQVQEDFQRYLNSQSKEVPSERDIAHFLSEWLDDNAPLNESGIYSLVARDFLSKFNITKKD